MFTAKLPIIILTGMMFAICVAGDVAAQTKLSHAQQTYILNCQGCHLADGSGSPGVVPRMKNFIGYFLRVEGGREFVVRVPGAASSPIDDQSLAELMNWLLVKFSKAQMPGTFVPYTAEEVGKLRQHPLIDVSAARAVLIKRIRDKLGISEAVPAGHT